MLTRGGCCPGAFWSADSQEVRFLARPEPTQPASIYAVPRDGGPAKLFRRGPAFFSPDDAYMMSLSGEDVVIEGVANGKRWKIPTGGRGVVFSHSMGSVAWTESSDAYTNLNLIQRTVWVTDLENAQSSKVITIVGGTFLGWTGDDGSVLVSGGLATGGPRGVWRVSLASGEPSLLFEADEVQSPLISPDGGLLAFFVAFGSAAEQDGLWVLNTGDGSADRLELFGSYRWRGDDRLLIVPLEIDQDGDSLWQYNASEGTMKRLFAAGQVAFKVANNDWAVSPDGAYISFRSASDQNIWTLVLPEE
jgi:Tol biopolymer transport system component